MAPPRAALAAAPLLIALLLASPACARSASGKFVLALKGNEVKPVPVESGFLNDESNIFAFEARTGLLTAELHAISSQRTDRDKSRCFKLALCDVTPMLARDNSFRSRPLYLSSTKLREQAAENVCGTFQRQETEIVCSSRNFSTRVRSALPELKRGRVFFVALFACPPCLIPNWPGDPSRLLVNYTINMRNTRAARPGLGWDEDVYRFAPAIVATLAMAVLVSIVGFAVVAFMRGARVPIVIAVLGVAAAVKCVIAIVTAVVYVRIAKTGSPLPGFFTARTPLLFLDDLIIVTLTIVMSTGTGLVPNSWILELRSTAFLITLGLSMHVVVLSADIAMLELAKVVRLFGEMRILRLVRFIITGAYGSVVTLICVHHSRTISDFMVKYAKIVRLSNVDVESTPVMRIIRFYRINVVMVSLAWLLTMLAYGVMDLRVKTRPDLLWLWLEAIDIMLLVWYAVSLIPLKNCAFFADITDVSNDRLRKVIAWRVRQNKRVTSYTGTDTSGEILIATTITAGVPDAPDDGMENSALRAAIANGTDFADVKVGAADIVDSSPADSVKERSAGDMYGAMHDSGAVGRAAGVATSATGDTSGVINDPEPAMLMWEPGMKLPVPMVGFLNVDDETLFKMLLRQVKDAQDAQDAQDAKEARNAGTPDANTEATVIAMN